MAEAGLILNNPNICSLAQYMVFCASHYLVDSLNVNFSDAATTTDGRHETLFLGL